MELQMGPRKLFPLGLLVACLSATTAIAQQIPSSLAQPQQNPSKGGSGLVQQVGLADFFTTRTPYEFWLAVLVAATGIATLWLMLRAIEKTNGLKAEDITRPMIVVIIVTSSLILVIAGFSNEQIAPAFGLFGTIVGYMLGRMSSVAASGQQQSVSTPNAPPIAAPPAGTTTAKPQ